MCQLKDVRAPQISLHLHARNGMKVDKYGIWKTKVSFRHEGTEILALKYLC